jgi:hypothetical protein
MKLLPVKNASGVRLFVNPDAIELITNDSDSESNCSMTIHFRSSYSRVSTGEGMALIEAINAEAINAEKEKPK